MKNRLIKMLGGFTDFEFKTEQDKKQKALENLTAAKTFCEDMLSQYAKDNVVLVSGSYSRWLDVIDSDVIVIGYQCELNLVSGNALHIAPWSFENYIRIGKD